jgi:hypothetical protein
MIYYCFETLIYYLFNFKAKIESQETELNLSTSMNNMLEDQLLDISIQFKAANV